MFSLLIFTLLAFTTVTYACEELCKNGTTDELVKRFWPIVDDVFTQAVSVFVCSLRRLTEARRSGKRYRNVKMSTANAYRVQ
jgi:DNA-binding response OmpR family regulator